MVLADEDVDLLVDEIKTLRERQTASDRIIVELQLKVRELERRPSIRYREVWDPHQQYDIGDFVTWGGSMWACARPSKGFKPGAHTSGTPEWRLAVKHGAEPKAGPPGPQGPPGRDGACICQRTR